ncbi:sulfatase-like hydrolase/transferase [Shigella flexneri]
MLRLISKAISWDYSHQMALPALYRQALLSDFLDAEHHAPIQQPAAQSINWLGRSRKKITAGYRGSSFNGTNIDDSNEQAFTRKYRRAAGNVNDRINRVLNALRDSGKLDDTVVIIAARWGYPLSEDPQTFDWSHGHLQVPLVIHWPGTPAQRIMR